ncbi:ATP-binding protein [Enterobacter cloacae complex sp. S3]|uniref:AAA family ATPase n=1 Tax=Enterobacter cloacae complex sp. S3 TaxID=2779537 RepID=UPI0018728F0F|nr:AAA family ATPase [Enterobacter cloacae complex sp. S3]MBE4861223.1 ATP-binding protein [Enterobacter cloacae complex sp. S3]
MKTLTENQKLQHPKRISAVVIKKLFGLYDYTLPGDNIFANIAVLYGENGVGKSTMLRMVFHLLSGTKNQSSSHLRSLYNIRFEKITVLIGNDVELSATQLKKNNSKVMKLSIQVGGLSFEWDYSPHENRLIRFDESDVFDEYYTSMDYSGLEVSMESYDLSEIKLNKIKDKQFKNRLGYYSTLRKVVPEVFLLNADRRLDGDSIADPADEVQLRRMVNNKEPRSIYGLVSRSREIALAQALNSAHKWISTKVVEGNNLGAENVHSVYINVLKHLSTSSQVFDLSDDKNTKEGLLKRLEEIDLLTKNLSKYELATILDTQSFFTALSDETKSYYHVSVELLSPYIDSLESRLNALIPIYNIIHKFVTTINEMLTDKTISYNLKTGFYINSSLGEKLEPNYLSSGEQQLLLLFLYVLVARDSKSLFMIDEPEISLNIKWQRNLIKALVDITDGESTQFIFASHSMEILSVHLDKVIRLEH